MIATAATTAVVVLLIYALMETIIDLFLCGSVWIAKQIMSGSITVFQDEDNILSSFYKLLPIGFSASDGKETFIDLEGIVEGISVAFLILIVTSAVLKNLAAPLTGEEAENPAQVAIRAVLALLLKYAIFGSSLFSFNGILGYIGKVFTVVMQYVGEKIADIDLSVFDDYVAGHLSVTVNPAAYVGLLILSGALVGAVVGAAITYIERILTFVVSLLVGPIAVMLYASKEQSDITRSWMRSIFAQLGAILVSLVMWVLFLAQLKSALHGDSAGFEAAFSGKAAGKRIFKLAVAIAILSLVRNSEKIFNNLGIRTMPNTESARALMGGMSTAMGGFMFATSLGFKAGPMVRNAVNNKIHGESGIAHGGGGSSYSSSSITTGNALFNQKGDMSVSSRSNLVNRAFARDVQGGFTTPLFGKDSVRSMQSRQASAVRHMTEAISGKNAGASISGMTAKYGKETKNFSAAQTANMVLSGRPEGNGRFAFVSSNQNANINKEGGTVNANGSAPSGLQNSIRVAETSSIDGAAVKGFAGTAAFSSHGVDAVKGEYFVPTENGFAELAVGQKINTGNGEEMQITGNRVAIDNFGAYAYEIMPVEDINLDHRITAENLPEILTPIFDQYFNDTTVVEKGTVISQQDLGKENIVNGESYDPN